MKAYLDAADQRGLLPMFYLELVSGLRKGELVALRWDNLDTQNRTISVSKQYIKNPNGELTLSRPKTETSVRQVSIPQTAVNLLIQEHEKHPDNPYLFPSPVTGEMYYPDSVVNLHKKILKMPDLNTSGSMICGTPSQPRLCKTAWTSRRYPACWVTTTPDSPSAPTPTPPGKNRTKQRPRWVPSWSRCCEDQDQKKPDRRHNPPARYSCLHCFLSASGSRYGSDS